VRHNEIYDEQRHDIDRVDGPRMPVVLGGEEVRQQLKKQHGHIADKTRVAGVLLTVSKLRAGKKSRPRNVTIVVESN